MWVRGQILGKGGFGFVSVATTDQEGNLPPLIAVKSAIFSESKSLSLEKQFLDKFQACPSVLRCFGDDVTIEEENKVKYYNLLLEYAAGGCLADRVVVEGRGLPENIVSRHAKSILTALIHMHRLGYVHCDVKPHNVLLVGEDAKLADFGSCQNIHEPSCDADGFKGTVLYAAPESVARQEYLPESDVWSLGCTVLHMLTGKSPWVIDKSKMDVKDVFLMIGYGSQVPHIPTNISKEAKDFLNKCLVKDPASRWKADRLIRHPFLKLGDNHHRARHLHLPSRLVPSCFHLPKVHAC